MVLAIDDQPQPVMAVSAYRTLNRHAASQRGGTLEPYEMTPAMSIPDMSPLGPGPTRFADISKQTEAARQRHMLPQSSGDDAMRYENQTVDDQPGLSYTYEVSIHIVESPDPS